MCLLLKKYREEKIMTARKPVETSEKVEEFIERARSRFAKETPEKKKRFPRFLIVVNTLVVLLVLYLYLTGDPTKTYFKSRMNMGGVQYNVSLTRESGSGTFLFTVKLVSMRDAAVAVPFDGNGVGCLKLYYGENEITGRCAGKELREVVLQKNGTKTFAVFMRRNDITAILKKREGERLFREHRRFFNPGKTLIPLRAVVTINTGGGVSSEYTIKYEVE